MQVSDIKLIKFIMRLKTRQLHIDKSLFILKYQLCFASSLYESKRYS